MILFLFLAISTGLLVPFGAIPVISTLAEQTTGQTNPVPINCVIIGDYQTDIAADPDSSQEQLLIANVTSILFNDPEVVFQASLNYFGYSSMSNSWLEDEDFTTMESKSDFQSMLSAYRDPSFPFPAMLNDFVEELNAIAKFNDTNRCLLFFSAVTDATPGSLTNTAIYDSLIAVGLNNNNVFPFAPTYAALSIPWVWSQQDAVNIANLVRRQFMPVTTTPVVTSTTPTIPPTTKTTALTPQPATRTPSTDSKSGFDTECKCATETVWNDVMFAIDRSNKTGADGLSEMYDTMLTLFYFFNVQAPGVSSPYHLRVGVVFYNSEATLAAPLGSTNQELFQLNTDQFYQKNDKGTDLEKGLRLAINQFDPSNSARRTTSRKVIVVMTTTYNPSGADAPQTVAAQFRDDNGILITYDYVEEHGEPALSLGELATPGYAMNSVQNGIDDLSEAQCSANCFCQPNYSPFTEDERSSPTAGCYKTVDVPANELLAERNCLNRHKGIVVEVESKKKNEFVGKLIKPASDTLIGLKWNATLSEWRWLDGDEVSSYSNFGLDSAHISGRDCVYMEKNTNVWKTVDCRQGFKYICEAKPCDSSNYCDGVE